MAVAWYLQKLVCISAFAVRPVFPHNEGQSVLILVLLTWWIFQLSPCGFALVEESLELGCFASTLTEECVTLELGCLVKYLTEEFSTLDWLALFADWLPLQLLDDGRCNTSTVGRGNGERSWNS